MILISVFTTRVPGEGYLETHVVYTEINIKRFFLISLKTAKRSRLDIHVLSDCVL